MMMMMIKYLAENKSHKKFGLMLTRHVKAYNSSCSQFIHGLCAAAEDRKNQ